jgi:hypothetical protein
LKKTTTTEGSSRDKASPINATELVSMGGVIHDAPSELLDAETDYFSHNSHLRLFLYRKYGIHFEDLSSTESHAAFDEFAKSYNAGDLERDYYNPPDRCCRRTRWINVHGPSTNGSFVLIGWKSRAWRWSERG